MLVRDDTQSIAKADGLIGGRLARARLLSTDEMHNGARASSHVTLSSGHSISLIIACDSVTHVANECSASQAVLKHDSVTKLKSSILSESVRHL